MTLVRCPSCGAQIPVKVGATEATCSLCGMHLRVFAATVDTGMFRSPIGEAIEGFLKSMGFEVRRFKE